MEGLGYAVGTSDLCAASAAPEVCGWLLTGVEAWDTAIPVSLGPPDIRQRLYWVADSDSERFDWIGIPEREERKEMPEVDGRCAISGAGDSIGAGLEGYAGYGDGSDESRRIEADTNGSTPTSSRPWDLFDIMHFTDGKKRRIEPGLVPLAHGLPARVVPSGDPGSPEYAKNTGEARVMRIRGYGNSIVPQLAAKFVTAFLEVNHAH
jgi:DNA (cytosine-5)-methyltransferase 1